MEARCEGRQRATGCMRTIQICRGDPLHDNVTLEMRVCLCQCVSIQVLGHLSAHTRCQATIFMKINEPGGLFAPPYGKHLRAIDSCIR